MGRSPIKREPLRTPGERAWAQFEGSFSYLLFYLGGGSAILVLLTIAYWISWYTGTLPHPVVFTLAVVAWLGVFSVWGWRGWKRGRAYRLGATGERAVADVLEEIASWGYRVFYGVEFEREGQKWDIDHIMIGPSGVYAIETKTWSMTGDGPFRITFDGEAVRKADGPRDAKPIEQARRAARDLEILLRPVLGERAAVRPVLVFPGWEVMERSGDAVWVLNPKRLFTWVRAEERNGDDGLSDDEVKRVAMRVEEEARRTIGR